MNRSCFSSLSNFYNLLLRQASKTPLSTLRWPATACTARSLSVCPRPKDRRCSPARDKPGNTIRGAAERKGISATFFFQLNEKGFASCETDCLEDVAVKVRIYHRPCRLSVDVQSRLPKPFQDFRQCSVPALPATTDLTTYLKAGSRQCGQGVQLKVEQSCKQMMRNLWYALKTHGIMAYQGCQHGHRCSVVEGRRLSEGDIKSISATLSPSFLRDACSIIPGLFPLHKRHISTLQTNRPAVSDESWLLILKWRVRQSASAYVKYEVRLFVTIYGGELGECYDYRIIR